MKHRSRRFTVPLVIAMTAAIVSASSATATGGSLDAVAVHLASENGSDEVGTAVLSAIGERTRVVISVTGEPPEDSQPANIHAGSCGGVEAIRYRLRDVRRGRSTSLIFVSLKTLVAARFVVNVQDSVKSLHAAKDARDVSCGAIDRAGETDPRHSSLAHDSSGTVQR